MIKISKKLWYVKGVDREDDLAYMSSYEENKEGEILSNVVKMQTTGRSWAWKAPINIYKLKENAKNSYDYERDEKNNVIVESVIPARNGEEAVIDNIAIKGFYIGSSVARWSTSNKLFRVKDPRGFTVEVPTDNIATLLHHCTVVNGIVQEECVWGREGNNHILLPVNSEPYLITLDQMDMLDNKIIRVKDLKAGDWVKFFEDDREFYYFGKVKVTWSVTPYNYNSLGYWSYQRTKVFGETVLVKDDKWVDVFLYKYSHQQDDDKWYTVHPSKPKIVNILKNEKMDVDKDNINLYLPDRVRNKVYAVGDWYHNESKIVSIEYK